MILKQINIFMKEGIIMSGFFENVMQSINLEKYLNNVNERKIVIYGTDENRNILSELLNYI